MRLTLVPAYGRDYKSKAAVEKDWADGKDFTICDVSSPHDGRYINLEDAVKAGLREVNIRYQKLTKVAVLKVT